MWQALIELVLDNQDIEVNLFKDILAQAFVTVGHNNALPVEIILLGPGVRVKTLDHARVHADTAVNGFVMIQLIGAAAKDLNKPFGYLHGMRGPASPP